MDSLQKSGGMTSMESSYLAFQLYVDYILIIVTHCLE